MVHGTSASGLLTNDNLKGIPSIEALRVLGRRWKNKKKKKKKKKERKRKKKKRKKKKEKKKEKEEGKKERNQDLEIFLDFFPSLFMA